MATVTRPMTADEFFMMPDDGLRHELIRGEVHTMSPPGGYHGEVMIEFGARIRDHVKANDLGRVYGGDAGFFIERDPDTVRGPDVAFVRRERLGEITERSKFVPFAPDLAVEVASPSDRPGEIGEKTQAWLAAGTRMAWNAFPESRTVRVDRPGVPPVTLREDDEIDGADVLPGFRCRVGDLFA
ncbi:MAG TPA: Uma2 family endonuclease [Isosphaeraceae bacterium]|jgi:Uma2 family endonuclease|nr:Uma2 family endonuclease [Isosphaeraceae bacterium]